MARVVVDVMLKPEILDPQGKAVHGALPRLGFDGVIDVRQGKRFELEFEGDVTEERLAEVRRAAETLLSNPGSNPVQVAGTLAQVGSDIGKATSAVKSTATSLKGLKPKGALRQAFQTAPSCTKLKGSL